MSDFKDLVVARRSHRKFLADEVDSEVLTTIMSAALMSPTSKGRRSWNFIIVDDKALIEKIADSKENGSAFLKGAPLAIVLMDNPMENDCWIEDCSLAALSIQYQAHDLGLGSCWIQIRGRGLSDGTTADEVLHGVLDIPQEMSVLCVVAIGHFADQRKPQNVDSLKWENVHINKF